MSSGLGFDICTPKDSRLDAALFGEAQGRAVVSVDNANVSELLKLAEKHGVPALHMGTVTSGQVIVNGEEWGSLEDYKNAYDTAIGDKIEA
jgi:phosphoribosylformylglycinamidine synthase